VSESSSQVRYTCIYRPAAFSHRFHLLPSTVPCLLQCTFFVFFSFFSWIKFVYNVTLQGHSLSSWCSIHRLCWGLLQHSLHPSLPWSSSWSFASWLPLTNSLTTSFLRSVACNAQRHHPLEPISCHFRDRSSANYWSPVVLAAIQQVPPLPLLQRTF